VEWVPTEALPDWPSGVHFAGGVGQWPSARKCFREYVFNANWHQNYQDLRHLLCKLRTKDEICVIYILPSVLTHCRLAITEPAVLPFDYMGLVIKSLGLGHGVKTWLVITEPALLRSGRNALQMNSLGQQRQPAIHTLISDWPSHNHSSASLSQ
jgi:hypothetical protein